MNVRWRRSRPNDPSGVGGPFGRVLRAHGNSWLSPPLFSTSCVKAGCLTKPLSRLGREESEGTGGGHISFNRLFAAAALASAIAAGVGGCGPSAAQIQLAQQRALESQQAADRAQAAAAQAQRPRTPPRSKPTAPKKPSTTRSRRSIASPIISIRSIAIAPPARPPATDSYGGGCLGFSRLQ